MESFPETVEIDGVDIGLTRISAPLFALKFYSGGGRRREDCAWAASLILWRRYRRTWRKPLKRHCGSILVAKWKTGTSSDTQRPQPYSFWARLELYLFCFPRTVWDWFTECTMHWWNSGHCFNHGDDKSKFSEIVCYRTVKYHRYQRSKETLPEKWKSCMLCAKSDKDENAWRNIRDRLRNGENIEEVFGCLKLKKISCKKCGQTLSLRISGTEP